MLALPTMSRKAQMASPFAFIFALVIGAIVLLFFIGFAYKFLSLGGSLSAAEVVSALNDEFVAFSVSDSAEKVLSYSQPFDFQVYEGRIRSNSQGVDLDQIVFSPLVIEGDEIVIATKAVELPYRVSNVFYVSDSRIVYIFVSDATSGEVVETLESSSAAFPKNIPHFAYTQAQLNDNVQDIYQLTASYDFVRFVFFTDADSSVDAIAQYFPSYDVLEVSSSTEDFSHGTVRFPDSEEVLYYSLPLLTGAIVSADSFSYQYNLNLLHEKMSVVTSVYSDKARFLSANLPGCDYTFVKSGLTSYSNIIGEADTSLSYFTQIEFVADSNKDLGGDCPEVF